MGKTNDERCRNLLIALRKIIQAIDQHSKSLKKNFGLTGPQLIILQSIVANDQISVTQLSKNVSLSQATVTDITKRLEKRGYITRKRSIDDKRKTNITLTENGKTIMETVPPLLQKQFMDRFSRLESWEQSMIESAFERVVSMMSAENIEASPIMITGSIESSELL
ncbi:MULTISPECIES: MarR family winged helix-turn-helix transcriptional regulator [Desulfobacula]|uniref:HTH-type transcriptional regulator SarZ n=2 Tax=Desulfobacula TaxID=28222 RepID=K0NF15_DESTT|nr:MULTISPECIES: MarR family transcriptional regulator [Desulfobacula]CCK79736.1 transcriptional regulator, MarR family [Desulfobacula toluolica Tol2]SDU59575.1 transcriptional regulator, MarR family [Desulfobacula phenolica]